jgi:geranylgeranyl reductase family protein
MKKYDVAVVGGGPSGLQTARLLAAAGFCVGLFEEKEEIGSHVICTGIVGREIFREFEIPDDSVIGELRSMNIVGPTGRTLFYEHPSAYASVVDRGRFDRGLARSAVLAGVDVRTGIQVQSAVISSKDVKLRIREKGHVAGMISAAVLVLATGIKNNLQKSLGLGAPKCFLAGVQSEIEIAGESGPSVFVGRGVAPGAFGWAVPTESGWMKVGLITDRDPQQNFLRFLAVVRPESPDAITAMDIKIKPIAQGLVPHTSAERVVVVGEAAGQVKTTTGGGIYYGLLGARVAADVITKSFRSGSFAASALVEYERLWRAVLKREILIGYYVRKAFSVLDDARIEKLMDVARQDGIMPLIRAKGHFDWQSGLIVDLLRKAPVFRLFREIGRPPVRLKKYWS